MVAVDREEHSRSVKQKILDAARELLVADGVEGFSMRKLAGKIGYTATGIYHHFPDKQAVLEEVIETDFRSLRASLGRIGNVGDPIDRIQQMGMAYVDFAIEFPSHYQILFMTPASLPPDTKIVRCDPAEDAYAFLKQVVIEGLALGRFRTEFLDADELSQIIWSSAHGLVSLHITKGNDPWVPWRDLRSVSEKLFEALLRGLVR
jgi:AcrR family transcriptional regulator